MGLAPADEADGVVFGPGPGRGFVVRRRQGAVECGRGEIESLQQVREGRGAGGVGDLLRPLRPSFDHSRPEALHLGEVPQQIGRIPVRTAGYPCPRVTRRKHLAES